MANPDQLARVLHHNPSYVFFGQRAGPPVGSLGVPLTPGRSIATDPRIFPPGSLAFLLTERPRRTDNGDVEWGPVSRFVLSQDVGGVIRGPGRVDVFWGRGPDADLAASEMKQPGELYVLVPKPPGIRPLSPAKPDPEVELRMPVDGPAPDARTPETEPRAPAVEARGPEAETRVAEAGVRALAEPPPADSAIDPDASAATTF
jgi:3D (Asp-Asp-Asp) domain-containing protein